MVTAPTGPFAGVRVVDASERMAGAYAARLFADHGADVVLAEPPEGHPARWVPPFVDDHPGPDRSLVHGYVNRSKRSVVIRDAAALEALVVAADVVVTTGRSLDVPDGAVHLSVTPHGLTGPLAAAPGEHLTACARTGWMLMNAHVDEPPVPLPDDVTSYLAGTVGFTVAAASVLERDRTGRGRLLDVSELEVLALTTVPWAAASVYRGEDTDGGPGGRRHRGRPGPLYDAAGGRISLGFGEWRDWGGAMRLLGLPELAEDPALVPTFGRHQQDLRPVGAGAARTVPELERWRLFRELGALRCGAGCVQDMADLLSDEQFAARGFLVPTSVAGREVRAPGSPDRSTPPRRRPPRPAPALGAGDPQPGPRRPLPSAASSEAPDPTGPLAGCRVLTFTQAWSGTLGTELLAFLGADVVQVEHLDRSDIWRNTAAGIPAAIADPRRRQVPQHVQGLYNSVNLDKRAIALDMTSEAGRELFWQLVSRFGVVAENFAPHVMPAWGITLERLTAARPGVVFASLSGYGGGGPFTTFPANGSTIEPMSGLSSLQGYADVDGGMNTGGLLPDPTAGMAFAAAIVAALAEQRRTGVAQRVDVAMTEAMATTFGDAVMQAAGGGGIRRAVGTRHRSMAPHGCYPTAGGGWIAIAASTEAMWDAVHDELTLADDGRFRTLTDRHRDAEALDDVIGAATLGRDGEELVATLLARGVAVAPVVRLTDVLRRPDPHFVARGFLADVDHPEAGTTLLAGRPWRYGSAEHPPLRAAPCVGQHSREVLAAELGLDDHEYDALVAAGVTGTL